MSKTLEAAKTLAGVAGTASAITYTISGDEVSGSTSTFKQLAQGVLANSAGTIYTPGSSAIVSEIVLVNTTGSPVTGVRLYQGGTAAGNQILGSITVPANGTVTLNGDGVQVVDGSGAQQVTFGSSTFTGDVSGSGTSPIVMTLATVNANVGTFGDASHSLTTTVNGKGLVTAMASQSIQIAESQVTNLTTDLAAKAPTGSYITALTGDVTATGPGSVAATLATVNATTGSFGSASTVNTITVNGKGLVTAITNQAISITASQVSNFNTAVQANRLDQMAAPNTDVSWASHKITSLLDPTNSQDAATKNYVDTIAAGVRQQHYAQVAKDTNQAALTGLPTVDGVTLTAGQSILLTAQSTASQNGEWLVASGAWTRPTYFATGSDAVGTYVFVLQGTVYAGSEWVILGAGPITVDTTSQVWQEVTGLFDVTVDATLVKTGNALRRAAISGDVVIGAASNAAAIQAGVVTNTMLATMATLTIKGNNSGGSASPTDLTATQVKTLLAIANTDVSGLGTASTKNVGNTVLDPGTGKLEYAWPYAGLVTAASKTYVATDRGYQYSRFNTGAAMSDTLPALTNTAPDIGWMLTVHNEGTTTTEVLTMNASGGALFRSNAGATSATSPVNYGCRQTFVWSGTQWLLNNGNANLLRRSGAIVAGEFPQFSDTAGNVVTSSGVSASSITTALAGKQATGNYITALTGDVAASGPGSAAATLATVNVTTGTFGDATHVPIVTVNGKGLVTAVTLATITAIGPATSTTSGSESASDYNRDRKEWDAYGDFGIVMNLRTAAEVTAAGTQVVMTSGSNVVNIPNAGATTPFAAGRDEGKRITVEGAGASGAVLDGFIGVVNSTTQVTVLATVGGSALNASTTVTASTSVAVFVQWGTDNSSAIAAMVSTINNQAYPTPKVTWGKTGLSDWTNAVGFKNQVVFNKSVWWEGIGGSHTADVGDYTKLGGTRLAWWGTSSDGGNPFGAMVTITPPASGAATPSFVRSQSTASGATSASAVGNLPVAPTTGNVLIAVVSGGSASLGVTPPSGWSLLSGPLAGGGSNYTTWIYWKVAAAEPSTWTWTLSGAVGNVVSVAEYTGVSTATPTFAAAAASSTTINTPTVTTPANNSIVIQAVSLGAGFTGSVFTITQPGSVTQDSQAGSNILANNSVSSQLSHDTALQAVAGTSTARTFTASATATMEAWTIAMGPAAAGAAVPSIKRPHFSDLWFDGRNGDQNQALYLLKMASCHGAMLDDGIFFMDALAQGLWLDISTTPTEASDTTRFAFGALCFRQLDNNLITAPVTTPIVLSAVASGGVLPTSTGITLTSASNPLTNGFTAGGGYAWVQTIIGAPTLIKYATATTTTLTGCIVSAEDFANAPTTFVNAQLVACTPGNGGAVKFSGGSGHNTCCGSVRDVQVSFGSTWGPAAIEFCNSDSVIFGTILMNGGSNVTETNGNRQRRPGFRFNGSNVSNTLASRNHVLRDVDPGGSPGGPLGGISVMGVLNTGAAMAFPAGPIYVELQQMGNGAPVPTVEAGAFVQWTGNGMFKEGPLGQSTSTAQALTAAAGNIVSGTTCVVPPQGWQVGTHLQWRIPLTKTAVGTSWSAGVRQHSSLTVGGGTLLANVTYTATAAIDAGVLLIDLDCDSLGGSGTVKGVYTLHHQLAATGLGTGAVTAGTALGAAAPATGLQMTTPAFTAFNTSAPGAGPTFLFVEINPITASTVMTVPGPVDFRCVKAANP